MLRKRDGPLTSKAWIHPNLKLRIKTKIQILESQRTCQKSYKLRALQILRGDKQFTKNRPRPILCKKDRSTRVYLTQTKTFRSKLTSCLSKEPTMILIKGNRNKTLDNYRSNLKRHKWTQIKLIQRSNFSKKKTKNLGLTYKQSKIIKKTS